MAKDEEPVIIETDKGSKDGQVKCPKCGSTEISHDIKSGKLVCNFCRCTFEEEKVEGIIKDISKLEGEVIGSGAKKIDKEAKDTITLKCSSCGAEVVIDTTSSTQARCHWCRNTLSINNQIPNGAVPDSILPFKIAKDEARKSIEDFVGKRKFYAHPKFKKEFTTENIMGVYFPYMLVDINAHANLKGEGEIETRSYTVKVGNNTERRYDADVYRVERDFDIVINGLSIESSKDKLNSASKEKTTNIINSIMPFDTENIVKYDSNYLRGHTSEKRDVNIDDLKPLVEVQAKDIVRYSANELIEDYDRGVRWEEEDVKIKGEQWISAYLPVWLYSYMQDKNGKKLLHYVAVNARTKETMGSVPIHMPKLLGISAIVELFGYGAMEMIDFSYDFLFLSAGVIYFLIIYSKYRNKGARHKYEMETKNEKSKVKNVDDYVTNRTGLSSSTIRGANNHTINGANSSKLVSFIENNKKGL